MEVSSDAQDERKPMNFLKRMFDRGSSQQPTAASTAASALPAVTLASPLAVLECKGCNRRYNIGQDAASASLEYGLSLPGYGLGLAQKAVVFVDSPPTPAEDLVDAFGAVADLAGAQQRARESWKPIQASLDRGVTRSWRCRSCDAVNEYPRQGIQKGVAPTSVTPPPAQPPAPQPHAPTPTTSHATPKPSASAPVPASPLPSQQMPVAQQPVATSNSTTPSSTVSHVAKTRTGRDESFTAKSSQHNDIEREVEFGKQLISAADSLDCEAVSIFAHAGARISQEEFRRVKSKLINYSVEREMYIQKREERSFAEGGDGMFRRHDKLWLSIYASRDEQMAVEQLHRSDRMLNLLRDLEDKIVRPATSIE
jgi:hypothetical protein